MSTKYCNMIQIVIPPWEFNQKAFLSNLFCFSSSIVSNNKRRQHHQPDCPLSATRNVSSPLSNNAINCDCYAKCQPVTPRNSNNRQNGFNTQCLRIQYSTRKTQRIQSGFFWNSGDPRRDQFLILNNLTSERR